MSVVYHQIERVLTEFKKGATYSNSIEAIEEIIRQQREEEAAKYIARMPKDGIAIAFRIREGEQVEMLEHVVGLAEVRQSKGNLVAVLLEDLLQTLVRGSKIIASL